MEFEQPPAEEIQSIRSLIAQGEFDKAHKQLDSLIAVRGEISETRALRQEIEKFRERKAGSYNKVVEVRSIVCPTCNGKLEPNLANSKSITCKSCSSILDLSKVAPELLGQLNARNFPPLSFIALGKIANIKGSKYQVIGRICFSSKTREWDPEDSVYTNERWKYHMWMLVGEKLNYLYISEDKEGYSTDESFVPTNPSIPTQGETHLSLQKDVRPQRILELSESTIDFFEGEFTWVPAVGDITHSAEYKYGSETFSVEWHVDEEGKTEEVEFYRSREITRLELASMFNETDILETERRKLEEKKKVKKWAYSAFALAVLSGLIALYALTASGKKLASFNLDLMHIDEEGSIRGPIELTKQGAIYQLALSTSIPDNTESWAAVELLDANQEAISGIDGEFWRESGYDSDGHWSESDIKRNFLFRLENPGTYYLRIFGDEDTAQSGSVSVTVYEEIKLARYYFAAMLYCLGFGFSMLRFKSVNPLWTAVGLFVLVILIFKLAREADDD